MMRFVAKAMFIGNIDGRCCIKKPESTIMFNWLLRPHFIASEAYTVHAHTYQHLHESDFKKAGTHLLE